jgi:hypothetical protein
MQLERLTVDLRRRNGWETLDLGLAMFRAWRAPVLRAWCSTYWLFVLIVAAATWNYPAIGAAIVWWAKPLFDRVLLFVYSQAIFGTLPSVSDVYRALPRLVRETRLLAGLTTYRLSLARSLFLPVWQLEKQRGNMAGKRRRVLGARGYGYAVWLTFFCSNLVGVLTLSGIVLIVMLAPLDSDGFTLLQDLMLPGEDRLATYRCLAVLTFIADTIVEPYFVAAGFSLYLNRRSELEAWDIEVAFRRMASRVPNVAPAVAQLLAALVVGIGLVSAPVPASCALEPEAVQAQRTVPAPFPPGEIAQRLHKILADPVFGGKETTQRWVYRERPGNGDLPAWLRDLLKDLERLAKWMASVFEVLVWIGGAALLALVLFLVVRYRERWWARRAPREIPALVFGLDVRPDSLPDDVGAAARRLLEEGKPIATLSLLYRGALSALIHRATVDLRPGDTETDCLERSRPALTVSGFDYFLGLLDAWRRAAYGWQVPNAGELRALCDAWPRFFGRSAALGETGP